MLSFILKIVKNIVLKLATTGAFSFMQPWLLKVDKWCEDKLGIDLIVQDKKFHEKYPLVSERLTAVEDDLDYCCKLAHPKCGIEEFDGYDKLIERIERLEKNA